MLRLANGVDTAHTWALQTLGHCKHLGTANTWALHTPFSETAPEKVQRTYIMDEMQVDTMTLCQLDALNRSSREH